MAPLKKGKKDLQPEKTHKINLLIRFSEIKIVKSQYIKWITIIILTTLKWKVFIIIIIKNRCRKSAINWFLLNLNIIGHINIGPLAHLILLFWFGFVSFHFVLLVVVFYNSSEFVSMAKEQSAYQNCPQNTGHCHLTVLPI